MLVRAGAGGAPQLEFRRWPDDFLLLGRGESRQQGQEAADAGGHLQVIKTGATLRLRAEHLLRRRRPWQLNKKSLFDSARGYLASRGPRGELG